MGDHKISFAAVLEPDGRRFNVAVKERELRRLKVSKLKEHLHKMTMVAVAHQDLWLGNLRLEDDWCCGDFEISPQSVLKVHVLEHGEIQAASAVAGGLFLQQLNAQREQHRKLMNKLRKPTRDLPPPPACSLRREIGLPMPPQAE